MGSLTTNRYQPPENVGDPLPPREAVMGGGGPLPPSGSRDRLSAAANGVPLNLPTGPAAYRSGGTASAAVGSGRGASAVPQASFMPFAMPTYAIPTIDGRAKVR